MDNDQNPSTATTTPPAATPPAETTPPQDPVKESLLPRILGLMGKENIPPNPQKDEDDDTTPPKAAAEPAKETPEPKPADKPADKPAEQDKKVSVKKTKKLDIKEVVKQTVDETLKATPPPAPVDKKPEPAATKPEPELDLTPEEKDELELATFIEKKDPARKGLVDKLKKFYAANKDFIEKAAAKAAEEGESYDPTTDPLYKKFLAANEPKLSASERKQFFKDKIIEDTRQATLKEAEEKFSPKFQELERKTLELEKRPVINNRIDRFIDEVAEGMPTEVVKFYNENGQDVEKTAKQFPFEFGIIQKTLAGAQNIAKELLEVRSGIKSFDPAKDPRHKFLNEFVDSQGTLFERSSKEDRTRDGKLFVHPFKYDPSMSGTHWTFSDEDVLAMLKHQANQQAADAIRKEEERLKALGFSRARAAAAAQNGVTQTPPAAAKPEPTPSPRTPSAPLPGMAQPGEVVGNSMLGILGYK